MGTKFKAAIFDLDGTLVSTKPEYRYLVLGNTLKELAVSVPDSSIDMFWFKGDRSRIVSKYFKVDPVLFWKTFRKHDSPQLRKEFTEPFKDVDILMKIKESGLKMGIVTGAPPHIVETELEMIGKDIFDKIILANHVSGIKEKPHPQGIHECLKIFGVDKKNAFFVGNALEDVLAAKNAKVLDILLDRGEYEDVTIKPTIKIQSLYELKNQLDI